MHVNINRKPYDRKQNYLTTLIHDLCV